MRLWNPEKKYIPAHKIELPRQNKTMWWLWVAKWWECLLFSWLVTPAWVESQTWIPRNISDFQRWEYLIEVTMLSLLLNSFNEVYWCLKNLIDLSYTTAEMTFFVWKIPHNFDARERNKKESVCDNSEK